MAVREGFSRHRKGPGRVLRSQLDGQASALLLLSCVVHSVILQSCSLSDPVVHSGISWTEAKGMLGMVHGEHEADRSLLGEEVWMLRFMRSINLCPGHKSDPLLPGDPILGGA